MTSLLFSLLLLFLPGSALCGITLPEQERTQLMPEALKKIHTLECDFQQEREVSVLAEKGVSRGRLIYKKNKALLWQYQVPDCSGFLLRADVMTILDPTGKPLSDDGSSGLFRHIGRIILMGIDGSILENKELFVPENIPSEDYIHIRLIPAQREMKRLFSDLELFFRKEDYVIQTVVINETSGTRQRCAWVISGSTGPWMTKPLMLMFLNNLYRIVDKVVYGEEARVTILLNRDSVIYKAHFPGNPITPGACIVEMGREIASLILEKDLVLEKADNIKFLTGIHPGETPRVVFVLQVQEQEKGRWRVRAEVRDGDNIMTKMTLCLKEMLSV